jgi:hypothetical protein
MAYFMPVTTVQADKGKQSADWQYYEGMTINVAPPIGPYRVNSLFIAILGSVHAAVDGGE